MTSTHLLKPLVPALVVCMLAGCAMPPGGAGAQQGPAAANQDPCSVAMTATAGAAVGAIVGALAGGTKGALIGAAAGGLVGGAGCYAINVHSRQLKTAAQADRDYVKTRGRLPAEPQVVAYDVQVSNVVHRGEPFTVSSQAEIVNGRAQQVTQVSERLVLLDTQGKPFKDGSKPLEANNASGGRFENSFELKLPQGVTQGVYGMQTNLYVNGQLAATRDLHTQLVMEDGVATVVATR